jgi:hypothetical protein
MTDGVTKATIWLPSADRDQTFPDATVIVKRSDGTIFFIWRGDNFFIYGSAEKVTVQCQNLGRMMCTNPLRVQTAWSKNIDELRKRMKKDKLPTGMFEKVLETFIDPMRKEMELLPYGDDGHTYKVLI